jgi:hypothetical protein
MAGKTYDIGVFAHSSTHGTLPISVFSQRNLIPIDPQRHAFEAGSESIGAAKKHGKFFNIPLITLLQNNCAKIISA